MVVELEGDSSDDNSSDSDSLAMELYAQRAAANKLPQETVKRLIQQAIATKQFPPQILCPEFDRSCDLVTTLFDFPVLAWVPECINLGHKPHCINTECACAPRLKEYRQRMSEDIDFRCRLLYVKYQCMGKREPRSSFSTVCDGYLKRDARTMIHFPFILTKKMGVSKALMELAHDGILSANGLSRTVDSVHRRREQRYYKLYSLFGYQVNQNLLRNQNYIVPTPPTVPQYSDKHCKLSPRMLRGVWLQSTEICSALCERLMIELQVTKALRIDHSVKFCKRLKLWNGGTGIRESIKDAKMLLLMQNEIGQIVGRRLTRSENNDEMRDLLLHIKSSFKPDESSISVVSDKASAIRNVVHDVFEGTVATKQDPFHVMQRFSEKLKHKGKRKTFYKLIHGAIYSVDGQLRSPEEMCEKVREVVESVNTSELTCSQSEWVGCLKSNLKQILAGDLAIDDNNYTEGGAQVSVVSTSHLEGSHAALKRLVARQVSAEVGLRILDIFILGHNLCVGAKFGRNPSLGHADIVTVAKAPLLCHGTLPETPLGEFVANLLSKPLMKPKYRSESTQDFAFWKWHSMFDSVRLNTGALEARLNRSRPHHNRIKELLLHQSVQRPKVSRMEFLQSLCLSEASFEMDDGFSTEEFELLRQLRREQGATGRSWSTAPLVTTILFNIVASSNPNQRLNIRRRSYATIAQRVTSLVAETETNSLPIRSTPRIFSCTHEASTENDTSHHEQVFQLELFSVLRATRQLTSIKTIFLQVYDFASSLCEGIYPKPEKMLLARWEAMKRASNRDASMKIKFKLPPSFRDQLDSPLQCIPPDTAVAGEIISESSYATYSSSPYGTSTEAALTSTTTTSTVNPRNTPPTEICRTTVDTDEQDVSTLLQGSTGAVQSTSIVDARSVYSADIITVDNTEARSPPQFQPPLISADHLAYLRSRANSLPSSRGKWTYMLSIFHELYPYATLSKEALRSPSARTIQK